MQNGERFKDKGTHVPADFAGVTGLPPAIPCPCGGGFCNTFTSKTERNPGRRFYTCPVVPKCGFFKWYDNPTDKQIASRPPSGNPICPCGSGPCRRLKETSGPNIGRSYFVCGIKKNFGACAFFQWEDAQIPSEPEEGRHSSSSASSGVPGSGAVDEKNFRAETNVISENGKSSTLETGMAENSYPADGFTLLIPCEENEVNQVTDGTHHVLSFIPEKECRVSVPVNGDPVEEESNPLEYRSNRPETVPSVVLAAAVSLNQEASHLETEENVLSLLNIKDIEPEEPVEAPGDQLSSGALSEFNSKENYDALEVDEAISVLLSIHEYETTSNEDSELIRQAVEHQSGSGETEGLFTNNPSLLDLIERYNSVKFHYENVSVRYVEALSAFMGSHRQLKSLHEKACRLRKLLLQTEKQLACCEAESLEFAASVQEVSGEMIESQKRIQETAEKLAKEIEVVKQRGFTIPKRKRD